MAAKSDYDVMTAGQEMDALVAVKVMGWERCHTSTKIPPDSLLEIWHEGIDQENKYKIKAYVCCWSPSTSISAAWQVVEKLTANNNGYFELHKDFGGWFTASFAIILSKDDERRKLGYGNWEYESEGNDTAPLAICRAALKALENTNDRPK